MTLIPGTQITVTSGAWRTTGNVIHAAPYSVLVEYEDRHGDTRHDWFDSATGRRMGDNGQDGVRIELEGAAV